MAEWGISDGIFLDGKALLRGPPKNYDAILKPIKNKIKK